jgi:hypothetical protein
MLIYKGHMFLPSRVSPQRRDGIASAGNAFAPPNQDNVHIHPTLKKCFGFFLYKHPNTETQMPR